MTEKRRETREKLAEEYSLSAKQVERDEKQTEARVMADVERSSHERGIAEKRFDDALEEAATEADAVAIEQEKASTRRRS